MTESIDNLKKLVKKQGTAKIVRLNFNKHSEANDLGKTVTASEMSRYSTGKRTMNPAFADWLKEQTFIHFTPFGSFVEVESPDKAIPWFRGLLNPLKNGDYIEALQLADIADATAKLTNAEENVVYARLSALRALIYVHLKKIDCARDAYEDACDRVKKCAPELYPCYYTSFLNAKRQSCAVAYQIDFNIEKYHMSLREVFEEQSMALKSYMKAADQELAFKHIMRCASLLDDEAVFEKTFKAFTENRPGEVSVEDITFKALEWMKKENDEDGDFRNARKFNCIFEAVLSLK